MRPESSISLGVLAAFFCLAVPHRSRAEVYQWVDKNGVVHMTDNPMELPEPQRTQVLRTLDKKQDEPSLPKRHKNYPPLPQGARQERLPMDRFPEEGKTLTREEDLAKEAETPTKRKRWENLMKQARKQVEHLKQQCQHLESEFNLNRRRSLITAQPGAGQAASRTLDKWRDCQRQLERAKQRLEIDLPEKARKSSVPPGWLRE
jgi:exonuclease VII small subunit